MAPRKGKDKRSQPPEQKRGLRAQDIFPLSRFRAESDIKAVAHAIPVKRWEGEGVIVIAPYTELLPRKAEIITVLVEPLAQEDIGEIKGKPVPGLPSEGILYHYFKEPCAPIVVDVLEGKLPRREPFRHDLCSVEVNLNIWGQRCKARKIE